MSGKRYLLDTNAIISLLGGNRKLASDLQDAEWVGISVISQLEFLVFPNLSEADKALFETLVSRLEVIGLVASQPELLSRIIGLRQTRKLKLPDAIVAGTALHYRASLVTFDAHFDDVPDLTLWRPEAG
jgi:tRNA(fMet)-specific endonuclease VapC